MDSVEILFLCGVFAPENEAEVLSHSKKSVEFSGNQMQLRLIRALREQAPTTVLSAPFIGHYPNQSNWVRFHGFSEPQDLCEYVPFHNLWGYRNFSRAAALKKRVDTFLARAGGRKLIVVYCAHDPFLAAAAYAKRKNPSVRICFVVPDLPQYMNLEANRSGFYDCCKKFDIRSIQKHTCAVDASVVLTREIASALKLDDRPFAVVEGVVDELPDLPAQLRKRDTVNVVYAGKLYERFGVKTLVDAFLSLPGKHWQLTICGSGDAVPYIQNATQMDSRIRYVGQIPPGEVSAYLRDADILVNPRPNEEEYTRYSFPSKVIEYLLQGKPVVAYMLDGMPACYRNFIYEISPQGNPVQALRSALETAALAPRDEIQSRYRAYRAYVSEHLLASAVGREILRISFERETM